jgi:hypothetical protein
MNPPVMNQASTTAQNVLSGQKTFETVQFAVTGDQAADMMSGVQALLMKQVMGYRQLALLLDYLSRRYELMAKDQERQTQFSQGLGGIDNIMSDPPPPYRTTLGTPQIQNPITPYGITTSAGAPPELDPQIRSLWKSLQAMDEAKI